MTLLWHYTPGDRWKSIQGDGVLKPATAFIDQDEQPVVWFTSRSTYEPTAAKMLKCPDGTIQHLDVDGTEKHGGGLYRIGVSPEVAPHDWRAWRYRSGVSNVTARRLLKLARERGSFPKKDWFVSFDPVDRDQWEIVQTRDGGEWVEVAVHQVG